MMNRKSPKSDIEHVVKEERHFKWDKMDGQNSPQKDI